jgi:hypothetical protein
MRRTLSRRELFHPVPVAPPLAPPPLQTTWSHLVSRATFGMTPDLSGGAAMMDAWLGQQLAPETIDDSAFASIVRSSIVSSLIGSPSPVCGGYGKTKPAVPVEICRVLASRPAPRTVTPWWRISASPTVVPATTVMISSSAALTMTYAMRQASSEIGIAAPD